LEKHFPLILANPYLVQSIPSEKTDPKDAEWIADLLARGLIRPSFVPPREIRELGDLTRHRVKLVQDRANVLEAVSLHFEDCPVPSSGCASYEHIKASGSFRIHLLKACCH